MPCRAGTATGRCRACTRVPVAMNRCVARRSCGEIFTFISLSESLKMEKSWGLRPRWGTRSFFRLSAAGQRAEWSPTCSSHKAAAAAHEWREARLAADYGRAAVEQQLEQQGAQNVSCITALGAAPRGRSRVGKHAAFSGTSPGLPCLDASPRVGKQRGNQPWALHAQHTCPWVRLCPTTDASLSRAFKTP